MIKTNFLSDEIARKGVHYAYIACIIIDSIMKMKKVSTSLFRRMQIQNKEDEDV